jgi:hypothetical protein
MILIVISFCLLRGNLHPLYKCHMCYKKIFPWTKLYNIDIDNMLEDKYMGRFYYRILCNECNEIEQMENIL